MPLEAHPLNDEERTALSAALAALTSADIRASLDENDLEEIHLRAQELPRKLRALFHRFRTGRQGRAGLRLTGLPFGRDELGSTPLDWPSAAARAEHGPARNAGLLLMLFGSLLGDVFAFGTQHGANPVVDVFPIQGHEAQQLGSSSDTELEWHNEDAFHPFRADFVLLFCLRNDQGVGTSFTSASSLSIPDSDWKILSAPRFRIRPDYSHTPQFSTVTSATSAATEDGFERMRHRSTEPEPVAVLSGHPDDPFIRIDPHFMTTGQDPQADDALRRLVDTVNATLDNVVLHSGDILLIDNRRAVHGRRPFTARYDGTDRWLKRINIAADLRRSTGQHPPGSPRLLL